MQAKIMWFLILILILVGVGSLLSGLSHNVVSTIEDAGRASSTPNEEQTQIMKSATFIGKLQEVNTGCYADGECYVVVDGKHVTTTMGWSQETVGSTLGVPSFGDLQNNIGKDIEVYAQEKADGTYTLYGDQAFYVKLK